MPGRYTRLAITILALGYAMPLGAGELSDFLSSMACDTKQRNAWPEPYVYPDRAGVRQAMAAQISAGWERQNLLSEFHFLPGGNELTEAGQLRLQWILNEVYEPHRQIYVHRANTPQETAIRMQTVQRFVAQSSYAMNVPVLESTRTDDGWPADRIDTVSTQGRHFGLGSQALGHQQQRHQRVGWRRRQPLNGRFGCRIVSLCVDGSDKVVFPPRRSVLENVRPKRWAGLPLVFACATVWLLAAEQAAAQNNSSSSWWSFGQLTTPPPPSPADDPISLKTPSKAGVELYVAVARMFIEAGKYREAEEKYQQAMKKWPNDLRVLLGYAMLKDQMNQPDEALKLYQQAEQKHPKQPSVYNNLAVHYARCGMVREAIEAARHAVELRPHESRYRNNLATLLVEAGMPREAFKQLREIYDEPVAHYDLGFLLNKQGMKAAALQEFTIALRLNPGMASARQWVERLSPERGEGRPAVLGMARPWGQVPAAVATNPPMPRDELPPPPLAPLPPPYVAPPPAEVQAPLQSPPPAQVQYPVPVPYPVVQYPAPPQNPPQFAGPQFAGPQFAAPQNAGPQYAPPQFAGPQFTTAPQNAGPQYAATAICGAAVYDRAAKCGTAAIQRRAAIHGGTAISQCRPAVSECRPGFAPRCQPRAGHRLARSAGHGCPHAAVPARGRQHPSSPPLERSARDGGCQSPGARFRDRGPRSSRLAAVRTAGWSVRWTSKSVRKKGRTGRSIRQIFAANPYGFSSTGFFLPTPDFSAAAGLRPRSLPVFLSQ